jgi:ubiquinone/menaquinone biosynthesis C-methylase UbiE
VSERYVLGYRREEQERLQRQARELAHESQWLFDQIGVGAGARVVEIGCGPLGCLELLAERVGPSGRIVGVERSEDAVELAREMARDRRFDHVEIRCGDARDTGLPRGSFDLVTARLVLVNVPEPERIIAEAVALARPGGWVAFHEADWIAHECDPPSEEWQAFVALFVRYSETNGIDPFIGRKLPRLLRAAGLEDVRVNPLVHVYAAGNARRTILHDFAENLSERLLAQGFVREGELADIKAALRRHLDDPETLVVSHLFFQAWGRKPAH